MFILMKNKHLIHNLMKYSIDFTSQCQSTQEVMMMSRVNAKQNFIKIYLILKIRDILLILKFCN